MEPIKTFHKVSCPCGAPLRIDPRGLDRSLRCPRCSYLLDFVVTVDAATKRSKVSIVVPLEALRGGGEESPAPKRARTQRGVFGTCLCGASFAVDDTELTTIQPCPKCGIAYHVVVKIERGTRKKTAMLVPVDVPAPPRPRVSNTSVPKSTHTGKRTRATAVKPPPPAIPAGAQVVECSCGEPIVVRRKDLEKGLACPSCGRALRFVDDRDPQTLVPRIRVRPDPKK